MQIRKTLIAMLALAIAVAFSPIDGLQAASVGPNSQPGTENVTIAVKAKAKAKAKAKGKRAKGKRGKRAASKRGGRCGTNMYFSKSKRSCQDARNKK